MAGGDKKGEIKRHDTSITTERRRTPPEYRIQAWQTLRTQISQWPLLGFKSDLEKGLVNSKLGVPLLVKCTHEKNLTKGQEKNKGSGTGQKGSSQSPKQQKGKLKCRHYFLDCSICSDPKVEPKERRWVNKAGGSRVEGSEGQRRQESLGGKCWGTPEVGVPELEEDTKAVGPELNG